VKRFVLDASVALAWFVDHPTPPLADAARRSLLHGAQAIVPALWHLEMANGFAMSERRGILTVADTALALENVGRLLGSAIETDVGPVSMRVAVNTARDFQLTAYDAVYIDTSCRHKFALATLDRRLASAAAKAGVPLFK